MLEIKLVDSQQNDWINCQKKS